jgi:hypothetical protein
MRKGEVIQLRDPVGNWAEFDVGDYLCSRDAYDVAMRPGQKWEGAVPLTVAPTFDRQGYCVLVYSSPNTRSAQTV